MNADYKAITECTRRTIRLIGASDGYGDAFSRATAANGALSLWISLTYLKVSRDEWDADQISLTQLVNSILRESP